jgi:hypothetical protein
MNIEDLMKHYTEGGRMIRHLNGKKEYILSEEDMRALKQLVKNCSIPAVSGEVCVKCGVSFMPRLFKERIICDKCYDNL